MISVEYLVLRNNVECTRLTADSETAAQVSMDNTAGIKMTLTGDFEINDKVNTLTDRLQVIMHINGTAYPLGKYVICGIEPQTTPAGRRVGSYTAYDLTYLVQSSKTERRYYIAAGTKYTDPDEQAMWMKRDPIKLQTAKLKEQYQVSDERLAAINAGVERELDEAWAYAEAAPYSEPEIAMQHIYAEC